MNVARWAEPRRAGWEELATLVRDARRRPERLGPERVLRLGAQYRAAAADLAYVRQRAPRDPVTAHLAQLVTRARSLVYDAPTRRVSPLRFFARGYWQLVLERPYLIAISAALLLVPASLAGAWAADDPAAAGGLVPPEYRSVSEPRPEGSDVGATAEEQAAFSAAVFTNNIQVSFLAFAGGIALGLLTVFVLVYNGVLLGAVTGLAISGGNGRVFFELVTAHGVLELSCIFVTAAAGLRIGSALLDPGRKTRRDAVGGEAKRAVAVVFGTIPWFVVAGLVEGFVTGTGIPLAAVLAVGFGLGALYWTLVFALGRGGEAAMDRALRDELAS